MHPTPTAETSSMPRATAHICCSISSVRTGLSLRQHARLPHHGRGRVRGSTSYPVHQARTRVFPGILTFCLYIEPVSTRRENAPLGSKKIARAASACVSFLRGERSYGRLLRP